MIIRNAIQKDVPAIIDLCQAHAAFEKADFDTTNKVELLSAHLFHPDGLVKCLVVEFENDIAGYATYMRQFSTWDAEFYIYLDCLYLKEKYRGQGLGKQLMQRIKADAKALNCNMIQWQTPDFNEKAIRFYQKLGAISKSKERFFWLVSD